MTHVDCTDRLAADMAAALNMAGLRSPGFTTRGSGGLPSWFDVTGLAAASVGTACAEIAALADSAATAADTEIDTRLASLWFDTSLRPVGWTLPPVWDAIAGLYQTADGWIRLHTNAPHHKQAALHVLDCAANPDSVAAAASRWTGIELETAVVNAGGCAAQMRSIDEWLAHPQGRAVSAEPLIAWSGVQHAIPPLQINSRRPLEGVRVLDLTRVLAGPVATRFLAAFGAEILRIDPPGWDEPNVVPEVTLGKRCATLNLADDRDAATFRDLLADADVLIHGYRSDALPCLGLGDRERRAVNPGLVDVALSAYGWTGPWQHRRGFDSLVQMSTGIAELGQQRATDRRPTPLPVQALDHATGYLMAAAALRALRLRNLNGAGMSARLSLARTAALLITTLQSSLPAALAGETGGDLSAAHEATDWGPAQRLRFPAAVGDMTPHWLIPARRLHREAASW